MSQYKVSTIPISDPLMLDDDDLRIILSALKRVRKYSGSVRADSLIYAIQHQLDNPDTNRLTKVGNEYRIVPN